MGLKVFRLLCTPLLSSAAHGWTRLAKHLQLVPVHSSKSRGAGVVWRAQLGVQHLRLTGGDHTTGAATFPPLGNSLPCPEAAGGRVTSYNT